MWGYHAINVLLMRFAWCLVVSTTSLIQALPTGAPNCTDPTVEPPVGPAHLLGNVTTGSLAEGNIVARLDDSIVLLADRVQEIQRERRYNVTIERATPFRGLLWRVGRGSFGADTDVTVDEDSDLVQISQACSAEGLGGVTHTSQVDKTSVSFFLTFETVDISVPIDLIVVVSQSPSEYYYSRFFVSSTLEFEADPTTAPPSASPSAIPSMLPTVTNATRSPTGEPTFLPTTAQSNSPTIIPSTATPTIIPTAMPLLTIYDWLVFSNFAIVELIDLTGPNGFRPTIDTDDGALTFFVPIDEAWESLKPRLDRWYRENVFATFRLLLQHTAEEIVPLEDLRNLQNLTMRTTEVFTITSNTLTGDLVVNKGKILVADQLATNGIVHTVDRIISIPTLAEYLQEENPMLFGYMESSGLLGDLGAAQGVTLFSPTLQSFENFVAAYPDLTAVVFFDPAFNLHLYDILAAHVAIEMYFQVDLSIGQGLEMLTGETITVTNVVTDIPASISLSPGATAFKIDEITLDAIVHVVDSVLPPPFVDKNLLDVVTTISTTLLDLIVMAGLDTDLSSTFGLTVLVPSDASLDALAMQSFETDLELVRLEAILSYHVVLSVIPSNLIPDGSTSVPTLFQNTPVTFSKTGNTIQVNGIATVLETDVLANNGIVHFIDNLLPVSDTWRPTVSPTLFPTSETKAPIEPTLRPTMTHFPSVTKAPIYQTFSPAPTSKDRLTATPTISPTTNVTAVPTGTPTNQPTFSNPSSVTCYSLLMSTFLLYLPLFYG